MAKQLTTRLEEGLIILPTCSTGLKQRVLKQLSLFVETIVGGTITTAEIYIVYMKESLFNRVL